MNEWFAKMFERIWSPIKERCPLCGTSYHAPIQRKFRCDNLDCNNIIVIEPDDVIGEGKLKNVRFRPNKGPHCTLDIYCSYECYEAMRPEYPDWGN